MLFCSFCRFLKMLGISEDHSESTNSRFYQSQMKNIQYFFNWNREKLREIEGQFYSKPYDTWSGEEVCEFLCHIKVSYTKTIWSEYKEIFESYDGPKLFELGEDYDELEDKLEDVIDNYDHLEILIPEIIGMRSNNNLFDPTKFICEQKVQRMFLKCFGDNVVELEKNKPFNDFLKYSRHFSDIPTIQKSIRNILLKNEEKIDNNNNNNIKKEFKVKFIITENLNDTVARQLRRIIDRPLRVATRFGLTNIRFGMFHAALAIGPLQLEWVDNSLTLLRSISSEKVLLCVDVGYHSVENIDSFTKLLAKECVRWNRDYTYEVVNLSRRKRFHANCQQFVEYFINGVLNLNLEFGEEIQKYLNFLKQGKTEMRLELSPSFIKHFEILVTSSKEKKPNNYVIKGGKVTFEDHETLDEFVSALILERKGFRQEFPGMWELLKGFDRAFWLKYFSSEKRLKKEQIAQAKKMGEKPPKSNGLDDEINFLNEYAPSKKSGCPFNIYTR